MNKAPWNDSSVRWVCEAHPRKDMSHRVWFFWECGGAGMPEDTPENRTKGYIQVDQEKDVECRPLIDI